MNDLCNSSSMPKQCNIQVPKVRLMILIIKATDGLIHHIYNWIGEHNIFRIRYSSFYRLNIEIVARCRLNFSAISISKF